METQPAEVLADGLLTVEQACAFSTLGKTELYKLLNSGRLASVKYGKRRLVPKRALMNLFAPGLVGAPAAQPLS